MPPLPVVDQRAGSHDGKRYQNEQEGVHRHPPSGGEPGLGQGACEGNALVRDAEVSKRFRDEFEQLWHEAPGRDHTLRVLQESIDKISAIT